jgi:hypothetical protein
MNSYTILATLAAGEDVRAVTFHDVKAENVERAHDWALTACRQLGVKLADNHAGRPDISIMRNDQPDAIRSAVATEPVKLQPVKRRYAVRRSTTKDDYMVVDTKRSIAVAYKPTYDEAVAEADRRDKLEA